MRRIVPATVVTAGAPRLGRGGARLTACWRPMLVALVGVVLGACARAPYRVHGSAPTGLVLAPSSALVRNAQNAVTGVRIETSLPRSCIGGSSGAVTIEAMQRWWQRAPRVVVIVSSTAAAQDHELIVRRALRAALTQPGCSPDEEALRSTLRRLPVPLSPQATAVDLQAGMRLRIERGSGTLLTAAADVEREVTEAEVLDALDTILVALHRPPLQRSARPAAGRAQERALGTGLGAGTAFAGTGTTVANVVADHKGKLLFEEFTRVRNVSPVAPTNGSTGVGAVSLPIDINGPAQKDPFAHWRLLLPTQLAPIHEPPSPRALTRTTLMLLVGGDDLPRLDGFTFEGIAAKCPDGLRCVGIPAHTYITPEVPVLIDGQLAYVGIGTTLGDVVGRQLDLATVSPAELDRRLQRRLRLRRRLGVELRDVRLPFDGRAGWRHITLRHGDVVSW